MRTPCILIAQACVTPNILAKNNRFGCIYYLSTKGKSYTNTFGLKCLNLSNQNPICEKNKTIVYGKE